MDHEELKQMQDAEYVDTDDPKAVAAALVLLSAAQEKLAKDFGIDLSKRCQFCAQIGSNKCKTCDISNYCSRECQVEDWPVHKLLCKKMKEQVMPVIAEGKEEWVRAISFPAYGNKPTFVWVPLMAKGKGYKVGDFITDGQHNQPHTDKCNICDIKWFLENKILFMRPVLAIERRMKYFQYHRLDLFYPHTQGFKKSEYPRNEAIALVTRHCPNNNWKGPFLAFRRAGADENNDGYYVNANTEDFRDVVDWLNMDPLTTLEKYDDPVEVVQAEMRGEVQWSGYAVPGCILSPQSKFTCDLTYIPRDHPIYRGSVPPLLERLELPLLVRRLPCSPVNAPDNWWVSKMFLDIDPSSDKFGTIIEKNMDIAGIVMLVRTDGRFLPDHHVKAIAQYCRDVVARLVEMILKKEVDEELDPARKILLRSALLLDVSKKGFTTYWTSVFKKKMVEEEPDTKDLPSPYVA